ncbi:MAG: hypothetical protein B7C54_11500 [Acidimicrobiales bacterium mtb01]|nr:iron ABC transporter permease [Actinomycetota bacterium]TEX45672.1 MAG: hypothetical protein B7C54_11500 [Acidimicrobiales bacterium mtb01]
MARHQGSIDLQRRQLRIPGRPLGRARVGTLVVRGLRRRSRRRSRTRSPQPPCRRGPVGRGLRVTTALASFATRRSLPGWAAIVAITASVAAPVVVVISSILDPTRSMWSELWATRLPGMIRDTLTLVVTVVSGSLVLGAGLAWLVTAYEFPARRVLTWLLVAPLAIPGYVAGFVWLDTLSGPLGARGVRSIWLCAAALIVTLYPYVFLFARASFKAQGIDARDAARTLGVGPVGAFFRVALPMARPALAAGSALVLMEVLTDIGTVRLFNVSTIADGVMRVWFGTGDRGAAAELACLLVVSAATLIALERGLRRGARYSARPSERPHSPITPRIGARVGALVVCATVVGVAVAIPVARLAAWALAARRSGNAVTVTGGVWHHLSSSLVIVLATCVACMGCGIAIALLARRRGSIGRLLSRLASLGYAMPGPVVAVGALITLAAFDRTGLLPDGTVLIGSLVGLVFALTTRFMAVAFQGIEAGLDRVPQSAVASARTLGAGSSRVAWSVELPVARTSIVAATALLTVDLTKELPITLLLRPFGFDTLSVWVWQATSESLWEQAAVPSLVMVAVGIVAVGALLVALDRGAEVAS